MQFQARKLTKSSVTYFSYLFVILNVQFFFINELFVSFVKELKINYSLRSITESSVNFQKLPLVNGTLPSS